MRKPTIKKYKGYDLHVFGITDNPNGRQTQQILIYKGKEFIAGSAADIELEDVMVKAKKKVDNIMRTLEENKLIAEFMTDEPEVLKRDLQKAGALESMHYHDEWGWIMPVIQKIDNTKTIESAGSDDFYYYCVALEGSCAKVTDSKSGNTIIDIDLGYTDWLKCAYYLAVEFIEWYNENLTS